MKSVRFLQSARDDVRREKTFTARISPELAQRFQNAVENAAVSHPLAMQIVEHEVQRWPLEIFPHGMLYLDEGEFILVLAVFYPKQAPEKWQRNLGTV
ncbi:MAG: hypothetical protein RQ732_05325 [Methylophaga sp.]|nr:hypothetical protein [Methylophaga sp.]